MIGSWSSVTKYRKQAIRSWQASSLYWLVSQVDKKGRKPQNAEGSHFVMVSQLVNKSFITRQILDSVPVNQSTSVSKRVGWWFVSSGSQTLGSWGDKTLLSIDRGQKYSLYRNNPSKPTSNQQQIKQSLCWSCVIKHPFLDHNLKFYGVLLKVVKGGQLKVVT